MTTHDDLLQAELLLAHPSVRAHVTALTMMRDAAPVWSSEWPTVPGWYWLRRPDKPPECASVFLAGSGDSVHVVHLIAGGFAYPGDRPGVLWGPRITPPGVSPCRRCPACGVMHELTMVAKINEHTFDDGREVCAGSGMSPS